MLAALATSTDPADPLAGLAVRDVGAEVTGKPPDGWARVAVTAASLNHHDLWTLRGVGVRAEQLPLVLGTDGAGVDEAGRPVVVHAVVTSPGWAGEETEDPARSLLSEVHPGTLAEHVHVPRRNLVALPEGISAVEAACLPTAWLTAYRMLFTRAGVAPGATVLVQGAGGGVSTALVALGAATGYRVWVTSRSAAKRERALALGADAAFEAGARLPERVDAVMESVGQATWAHSLRAVRPGGSVVVCGATSGDAPPAELRRVFFSQLRVVGSTMGSRGELERLLALLVTTGLRPVVDSVLPLADAAEGLRRLDAGDVFGKVVLVP